MSCMRIILFSLVIVFLAPGFSNAENPDVNFANRVFGELPTDAPIGCEDTAKRMGEYLNYISAGAASSRDSYLAIVDSLGGAIDQFPSNAQQHFYAVRASVGNSYALLGHNDLALESLRSGISDLKELSKQLDKYLDFDYQPAKPFTPDQACLIQHDVVQMYFSATIYLTLIEKIMTGSEGIELSAEVETYIEYFQGRLNTYGPAIDAMGLER